MLRPYSKRALGRKHRRRKRRGVFEQLESRLVLASAWQNPGQALDVNDDLSLSPIDVLVGINRLNEVGPRSLTGRERTPIDPYFDTNGDGSHSPLDVLLPINALNELAPVIAARLSNDTAPSGTINQDRVTRDPSISGRISVNGASTLLASIGSRDEPPTVDISQALQASSFVIDEATLDAIFGAELPDGVHTLNLQAEDQTGPSKSMSLTFTLDRVGPSANVDVDATVRVAFDTFDVAFDEPIAIELVPNDFSLSIADGPRAGEILSIAAVNTIGDSVVRLQLSERVADQAYEFEFLSEISDLAGNLAKPPPVQFTVADPTGISQISPARGERMVNVTRETIIRFDEPIDPTTVTQESFYLVANGQRVPGRVDVSSTERFATFYYDAPLPASTEVQIVIDGSQIMGRDGLALDADGDNNPGGNITANFRTLPLTRIAGTKVFGFVRDSYSEHPLVGATVRVDAFPAANAVTDSSGRFELIDMPAPDFFVHIDGSTATHLNVDGTLVPIDTTSMSYPSVGKPFHSVARQEVQLSMNGVAFDVFLPPMTLGDVQQLSTVEDTVIRFGAGALAGLESLFPEIDATVWNEMSVTYPVGSARDAEGRAVTAGIVIPVPPNRLPAPLPPEITTSLVVSVQAPGAAVFDVPAPMTMPNVDGLPAGSKTQLVSFNHSAGRWEAVGTATVSGDGRTITTDSGVGIRAPGWHVLSPIVRVTGTVLLPLPGRRLENTFSQLPLPLDLDNIPLGKAVVPQSELFLAFENQESGFVSRITADADGDFEILFNADTSFRLYAYDRAADLAGRFEFTTSARGTTLDLNTSSEPFRLGAADLLDSDGDGLTDVAERAIGTLQDNPDTDGDGIDDFSEIQLLTDPFGGAGFLTGKISEIQFAGEFIRDIIVAPTNNERGGLQQLYAYALSITNPFLLPNSIAAYLQVIDITDPRQPAIISTLEFDTEYEVPQLYGDPLAYDSATGVLSLSMFQVSGDGVMVPEVRFYKTEGGRLRVAHAPLPINARQTVLKDGLAYVVIPDPRLDFYSVELTCLYCLQNDAIAIIDYSTGRRLDYREFPERIIYDIALSDDALYLVDAAIDWSSSVVNSEVRAYRNWTLLTEKIEPRDNRYLATRTISTPVPSFDCGGKEHIRIAEEDGLVAITGHIVGHGCLFLGVPGISTFVDEGNELTFANEDAIVFATYRAALDGNGLAATWSMPRIGNVYVLDLADPSVTDQTVAVLEASTAYSDLYSEFYVSPTPAVFNGRILYQDGENLAISNYLPVELTAERTLLQFKTSSLDIDPSQPGLQVTENTVLRLETDVVRGRIGSVELFENGRLRAVGMAPDYSFSVPALVTNDQPTSVEYVVRATDSAGRTVVSESITIDVVKDTFAPIVASITPNADAVVAGNQRSATIAFNEVVTPTSLDELNLQIVEVASDLPIELNAVIFAPAGTAIVIEFDPPSIGEYAIRFQQEAILDQAENVMGMGMFESRFSVAELKVTWTGTDGDWSNPSNWDLGRVPNENDIAVIGANAGEVHINNSEIAIRVRGIQTSSPLLIRETTIEIEDAIRFSHRLTLDAATIVGGSLVSTNAVGEVSIPVGSRIGLKNVRIGDGIVVTSSNAVISVFGELTLDGNLSFDSGSGDVYFAFSDSTDQVANVGGAGTIRLSGRATNFAVAADELRIEENVSLVFDGNGSVTGFGPLVNGRRSATRLYNHGTITVGGGRLFRVETDGLFGTGSLTLGRDATLRLEGTITTAQLSGIGLSDAKVELGGILNNESATLHATSLASEIVLDGGTIVGGTIETGDGSSLTTTNSKGNRLSGVAIDGNLVLGVYLHTSSELTIDNGLSISGNLVHAASSLGLGGVLTFDGDGETQTLNVRGTTDFPSTVIVDNNHTLILPASLSVISPQDVVFLSPQFGTGGTLVNEVDLSLTKAFRVDLRSFENRGAISLVHEDAQLVLNGSWTNTGSISLEEGRFDLGGSFKLADLGDFQRTGGEVRLTGTLDNRGLTFAADSYTGSIVADDGTILGGTLEAPRDGAALTDISLTLDSVTVAENLDYVVSGHTFILANDYQVLGSIVSPEGRGIVIEGESKISQFQNITLQPGTFPGQPGTFPGLVELFNGTIDFEGAELNPSNLFGGSLRTTDATLRNVAITERTTNVSFGGFFLALDNVTIDRVIGFNTKVRLEGPLTLNANLVLSQPLGSFTPIGIEVGPGTHRIDGTDAIVFGSLGTPRITGLAADSGLIIGDGVTLRTNNSPLQVSGLALFENRGAIEVRGTNSTIRATAITNAGTIVAEAGVRLDVHGLAANSGTITSQVNSTVSLLMNAGSPVYFDPDGTLAIEVAGSQRDQRGHLRIGSSNSTALNTLGGALHVRFTDGFDPDVGELIEIGEFTLLSGDFDTITFEGLGAGKQALLRKDANELQVEIVSAL